MLRFDMIPSELAENPENVPSVLWNDTPVSLIELPASTQEFIFGHFMDSQQYDVVRKLLQFNLNLELSPTVIMQGLFGDILHEEHTRMRENLATPIYFSHENTLELMATLVEKGVDLTEPAFLGQLGSVIRSLMTNLNLIEFNQNDAISFLDIAILANSKRATKLLLELGVSPMQMHPAVRALIIQKFTDPDWRDLLLTHYEGLLSTFKLQTLRELAAKSLFDNLKGKEKLNDMSFSEFLPEELITLYRTTLERETKRKRETEKLAFYEENLMLSEPEKKRIRKQDNLQP